MTDRFALAEHAVLDSTNDLLRRSPGRPNESFAQFADHGAPPTELAAEVCATPIFRASRSAAVEEQHGDLAVNAAMVLAKTLDQTQRTGGEDREEIGDVPKVRKVRDRGPGFINVTLTGAGSSLSGVVDRSDFGRAASARPSGSQSRRIRQPDRPVQVGHGSARSSAKLGKLLAFAALQVRANLM